VQVLQGIAFVLILASESLRSVDWAAVAKKWRQRATPEPVESPAPVAAKERVA
jgi:simple sugar transport system permease protein